MLISFVSICVRRGWACVADTFMAGTSSVSLFSVDNPAVASTAY